MGKYDLNLKCEEAALLAVGSNFETFELSELIGIEDPDLVLLSTPAYWELVAQCNEAKKIFDALNREACICIEKERLDEPHISPLSGLPSLY